MKGYVDTSFYDYLKKNHIKDNASKHYMKPNSKSALSSLGTRMQKKGIVRKNGK